MISGISKQGTSLRFFDGGAERHKGEFSEFEALFSEGNADYGDAPEKSGEEETDAESQSAEYDPYHVQYGVFGKIGFDFFPEGPENYPRQFETLFPEGNADYRNAPEQS